MSRPMWGWVAAVAVLGCTVAAVWWGTRRDAGAPGDPPRPAPGMVADPMIADAIERAVAVVEAEPRSAAARAALAMTCHGNGLTAQAAAAYEQALQLDPDEPRWWCHLARARADLGELDAAVAAIERGSALAPDHAPLHWRRGFWLLDLGRLDEATAAFARAIEIDPADPAGHVGRARADLLRDRPRAALQTLHALETQPAHGAYVARLIGDCRRRLGAVEEHDRFAGAPAQRPVWADPWADEVERQRTGYVAIIQRADALTAAGRTGAALGLLRELQVGRPDDAPLAAKVGETQLAAGDRAGARRSLDRALRLDERYAPAHLHLSRLCLLEENRTAALRHAERAAILNPVLGAAHAQRAAVLMTPPQQWPAAAEALEQAVRHGAADVETQVNLGLARYHAGRFDESARGLAAVLDQHPRHMRALIVATLAEAARGDRARAGELLRRAAEIDPENPLLREVAAKLESRK